jgi:DNA-binding CsgD family transcriptional regulator
MTPSVARLVLKNFRGALAPTEELAGDGSGLSRLTPREREVLECLSRGFSYEEIGGQLGCQARTVNSHLHHIYRKLHVHSAAGAVGKYLRGD